MPDRVKRTERGWGGHFICANRCRFRRNTLLEFDGVMIVVSTVGLLENRNGKGFDTIGAGGRMFETMAFHADPNDTRYHDADVSRQVYFNSPWSINDKTDADDLANEMHETVVDEISSRLLAGEAFEVEK